MKKTLKRFLMHCMRVPLPYRIICTHLVLKDEPVKVVDSIFFFGRVPKDQTPALFAHGVHLYNNGIARSFLINGIEDPKFGHTKTAWTKRLMDMDVSEEDIVSFPPAENTAAEALAMIAFAQKNGWKSATILAQPHQLLRCMRALIAAMNKQGYLMQIYCSAPQCDFFEITTGSQNLLPMERWKHIAIEYSPLLEIFYPLAPLQEVLTYYKIRNQIQ